MPVFLLLLYYNKILYDSCNKEWFYQGGLCESGTEMLNYQLCLDKGLIEFM